ncbi:hypothetical protein B0H13DRAFT_1869552 [Mycena leptocephala]|nr:hypothetical protein B0H13DRAFT_1869552 [Mycena leptocephala]
MTKANRDIQRDTFLSSLILPTMNPSYYDTHHLRPPSVNDTVFRCPKRGCRRRLQLRRATSRAHKGQDYLKCYNSKHEDLVPAFWYFFPLQAPAANNTARAALPPTPDLPLILRQSETPNEYMLPTLNSTCKIHCEIAGGCPTHAPSAPPPSLPDFSAQDLLVLRAIKDYADSTPRAAEHIRQQTSLRQQKLIASLPYVPSPSPSPARIHDNQHILAQTADRSFPLIHWPVHHQPAVVSGIQNPPSWPYWTFSTEDPFYESYSSKFSTWMKIPANYVHKVTSGRPILIRRLGINGSDERQQVEHLRAFLDLADEPVLPPATRTKSKKRKSRGIIEIDSSDDGAATKREDVGSSDDAPSSKSKKSKGKTRHQPTGKESDDDVVVVDQRFVTPPRRLKRARLDHDLISDSSPPLPSISYSTSSAASTSRLSSPPSPADYYPFALLPSLY